MRGAEPRSEPQELLDPGRVLTRQQVQRPRGDHRLAQALHAPGRLAIARRLELLRERVALEREAGDRQRVERVDPSLELCGHPSPPVRQGSDQRID
jgi:hypothetical protein